LTDVTQIVRLERMVFLPHKLRIARSRPNCPKAAGGFDPSGALDGYGRGFELLPLVACD